ncbi:methyltransferase [Mesorhizobium sp. M2A.F.Ca.ET.039.01.1.1]|uniref:methyltransferase n=1 Tax=Mesorhizobium sp. M2A.F.Ca.ET.039.01.1.1 TaxID=2496746 RepID=UPI001AEC9D13|nr:methyltransferase [Mesorhizobium sp. M2A.F.Ca.ET.039.01.1.1]
MLTAAGGKWNKKAGAHLFEGDAAEAIEPILLTGTYQRTKQDFGQFDTPPDLAERIVAMAGIKHGMGVIEPSAGLGNIASEVLDAGGEVMCIEIDAKRVEALKRRGFRSIIHADFLSLHGLSPHDRVVMNPPFAKQADIDHVLHAAKFLKPGGRLVGIMSQSVLYRSDRKATAFRDQVAAWGGEFEELPAGAFKSAGTMVRACIVSFDR